MSGMTEPTELDPLGALDDAMLDLYTDRLMDLNAKAAGTTRLTTPDGSAKKRSRICGSEILVELAVDPETGRVDDISQTVKACALGNASAAILVAGAKGATRAELEAARDAIAAYLRGEGPLPSSTRWADIDVLAPARDVKARHPAVRLPFEAAVEAMINAEKNKGPTP